MDVQPTLHQARLHKPASLAINQDCKAERFKNVGLQGDLDKFYEQRGLIGDYEPNGG